jgi:hypothetical protein
MGESEVTRFKTSTGNNSDLVTVPILQEWINRIYKGVKTNILKELGKLTL